MPIAKYLDILDDLLTRDAKRAPMPPMRCCSRAPPSAIAERLGKAEKLERSEGQDLGLRVLIGKRRPSSRRTTSPPKALDELVERAVAMAKAVPEDPFCGLADPAEMAHDCPTSTSAIPTSPRPRR